MCLDADEWQISGATITLLVSSWFVGLEHDYQVGTAVWLYAEDPIQQWWRIHQWCNLGSIQM